MDQIEIFPVTRKRWPDMQTLFDASAKEDPGHPSRCWCMELRCNTTDGNQGGEADATRNRKAMEQLIEAGQIPGILAYKNGEPVGWCSVSPREQLTLDSAYRSQPPGTPDVWSVACFYVSENQRGEGLMTALLAAAVEYARAQGAKVIEGYPVSADLKTDGAAGTPAVFEDVGFVKVADINPFQYVMCIAAEV